MLPWVSRQNAYKLFHVRDIFSPSFENAFEIVRMQERVLWSSKLHTEIEGQLRRIRQPLIRIKRRLFKARCSAWCSMFRNTLTFKQLTSWDINVFGTFAKRNKTWNTTIGIEVKAPERVWCLSRAAWPVNDCIPVVLSHLRVSMSGVAKMWRRLSINLTIQSFHRLS